MQLEKLEMKIRNVVFAHCHIEPSNYHLGNKCDYFSFLIHFCVQMSELLAVQFSKSSKRCGAHIPHIKVNVLLCTVYTYVIDVFTTFQPNAGAKMFISDGKEKCKQTGNTHIHTHPF